MQKKKQMFDYENIYGSQDDIKDLKVIGDPDTFKLLCELSSQEEGWMKSTRAMEIPQVGCVVKVTTQQLGTVTETMCFVPDCRIVTDINGGKKLEK